MFIAETQERVTPTNLIFQNVFLVQSETGSDFHILVANISCTKLSYKQFDLIFDDQNTSSLKISCLQLTKPQAHSEQQKKKTMGS